MCTLCVRYYMYVIMCTLLSCTVFFPTCCDTGSAYQGYTVQVTAFLNDNVYLYILHNPLTLAL